MVAHLRRMTSLSLAVLALLAVSALSASAQMGPQGAINPQRDCITVRACNFAKGGRYRGCVSSYSCRTCAFVPAKCSIGGDRGRLCERLQCGWGT
jgi:hypothetical protein